MVGNNLFNNHVPGRKVKRNNGLLMRVKEKSKKAGLKLSIKKTKIKASSPITSWQTEGAKVEAVTDFVSLGFKITADGDCSHEIERRLLLGRKGKPRQQVKKQRHHFADKGQSYGFSNSCVQM